MRVGAAAISIILAAVWLPACGAGSDNPSVSNRTFELGLSGVRGAFVPMSPHGSAKATIRVLGHGDRVCWSFRALEGVTAPTHAEIRLGSAGQYGSVVVALGSRYAASGCTGSLSATALAGLVANPLTYYLEVDTADYPVGGAIRTQL
jgi:hypothetical protein